MLIHPFLGLVHGGVGVGAVLLARGVLCGAHVVVAGRRLAGVRQVRVVRVVVDVAVARMRDGVVVVVALPVQHLVRRQRRSVVSRRHLHLPQRVLRVDAAPVVTVRVTVLYEAHVYPCEQFPGLISDRSFLGGSNATCKACSPDKGCCYLLCRL